MSLDNDRVTMIVYFKLFISINYEMETQFMAIYQGVIIEGLLCTLVELII